MFSSIRQKFIRKRQKEIPLERLSCLWTEKEMTESRSLQHLPAESWRNHAINQFYTGYVGPYMAALGPSVPVIDHILTLLEDKGDCLFKSHDPENENKNNIDETGIPLREYSLTAARMAVDMIKKAHRDFELILGKILIISLGHALGVLSSASTIGGTYAKSILILHPLIQNLSFKQDIITAIHTFQDNHPKTDAAKILKSASLAAKKQIREQLQVLTGMNQPATPDITTIRAAIFPHEAKQS